MKKILFLFLVFSAILFAQIPPTIILNLPTNNTQFNNTQDINFNFTATDDNSTTLNCSIYLDSVLNQTNSSVLNNTLTNFLIQGIAYGTHNWFVNCSDGNLTDVSEIRSFSIVDTIPPSITFISPTPANASSISSTQTITVNATDLSAISEIVIYIDNINIKSCSSSSCSYFWDTTTYSEGNHLFNATANDTSNNRNWTETRTITINNTNSWPMFHFNLNHIGYSPSSAPTSAYLKWNYTMGWIYSSSPAIANGMVFIGSYDRKVYALNQSTGAHIWNYTTGEVIDSSPAIANGMVFIGSTDNKTYALNQSTGAHIWNYTTGGEIYSSPAVADGIVFIGSYDFKLYALNQFTGAHIWNYTTGWLIDSSPAVADGIVFIGSFDNKIYALNQFTGAHIWNYTTGDVIYSSPAVADGMIIIGSSSARVYALNQSTGAHIWNYTTGGEISSSPAVADGMVFIGSTDNKTYALNQSTGAHIWNYTTGGGISYSSPAVADGMVFIGSTDNKTYALSQSTGIHIWNYTTGDQIWSSPAIAGGIVFIGSQDRKLYAFSFNSAPAIILNLPTNNTQFNNTQNINFNFTATDDNNLTLSCSIYLDSVLNQTNSSVLNNTLTNFLIQGIAYGTHNWFVNCSDGNLTNVSETRNFSIVNTCGVLNSNTTLPNNISSNGTCYTIGANGITLNCVGYSITGNGTGIGINISGKTDINIENCKILNFSVGINATSSSVNVANTTSNNSGYGIRFDNSNGTLSNNTICSNSVRDIWTSEFNGSGSSGHCDLFTNWTEAGHNGCTYSCSALWERYFGNLTTTILIAANASPNSVYSWNAMPLNLYIVNKDANIDWYSLQALGKKNDSTNSSNDFIEMDNILSTNNYSDNVTNVYSINGSSPKATANFTIYGANIINVPINESAPESIFTTGILWDTSDGNIEFNGTQDIVFVVKANISVSDIYGIYDYNIKIPKELATYKGGSNQIIIYTEAK